MRLYARMRWAIYMLCAFVSAAGAQVTTVTSNKFSIAPRIVDQSDAGAMVSTLYMNFKPDTVVDFGATVSVVDSVDTSSAPVEFIADFTVRWKGQLHSYRDTVKQDAQYYLPNGDKDNGVGIPDSVFYIVWDKPGDDDRYTYQSRPQTSPHFDPETGSMLTMDHFISEILEGHAFFIVADSALGAATDTLSIGIITPNTDTRLHLTYSADMSALGYFSIHESVTITAGDTITVYNSDRNAARTSEAVAMRSVTGAAGTGTKLRSNILGNYQSVGGDGLAVSELVLKKNTKYLFSLVATAASKANIRIVWYESVGQ